MRCSQPWVVIGEITRPHGVRGDVKVMVHTDYPHRFESLDEVYLQVEGVQPELRSFTLLSRHGDQLICRIGGIESREAAGTLRGALLVVPRDEAVELPLGEFYIFELIGLQVYTEDGKHLGQLKDVLRPGANDVYVVESKTSGNEILLPAIAEVILNVDLKQGNMVVRLLPGLLD